MHLSTVDIDATFDLLMFQCDALKFLGTSDFEKFEMAYSSMRWYLIVVIIHGGLRIPWEHGMRKQPVNVATGGLHASFHFTFISVFTTIPKFQLKIMSP